VTEVATEVRGAAIGEGIPDLAEVLAEAGDAEVRFDAGSRSVYVTDGSNYRQVPLGVVVPYSVAAGARAVQVCARFGAPIASITRLARGAHRCSAAGPPCRRTATSTRS
jgi:FAD/FMN-containing dehydrogenase